MIVEGIVTTVHADGTVNVAAMGATVDREDPALWRRLVLRPFAPSATLTNLRRTGEAVFHVTDDVELVARAALNRLQSPPKLVPAASVSGWILADACRWYSLRVRRVEESPLRPEFESEVVACGRFRDFFGLSRAKHAVVEAAILATRIEFHDPSALVDQLRQLRTLVDKTGGGGELAAMDFLADYVAGVLGEER